MVENILDHLQRVLAGHGIAGTDCPRAELAALPWRATGIDSLKILEIVLELEDLFTCEIDNNLLKGVDTFGDLAHLVEQILIAAEK